jgi:hypothetical protein
MRTMITTLLLLICAGSAYAQAPQGGSATGAPKPSLTVDQIIEKSINATGGREAAMKLTSLVMTGTVDIAAFGLSGSTQTYQKAPDKYYTVADIAGFGQVSDGYDGKAGWHSDPQTGLTDLTGDKLATVKMEAQFLGDLRFKELYPKSEVTGQEKVGGRDCWVLKLTSVEGKNSTRYYDAETFLLVKASETADTPQGPAEVETVLSDYKDIGNGAKLPYKAVLNIPGVGELVIIQKEIKYNVPIDDAKFTKPAK